MSSPASPASPWASRPPPASPSCRPVSPAIPRRSRPPPTIWQEPGPRPPVGSRPGVLPPSLYLSFHREQAGTEDGGWWAQEDDVTLLRLKKPCLGSRARQTVRAEGKGLKGSQWEDRCWRRRRNPRATGAEGQRPGHGRRRRVIAGAGVGDGICRQGWGKWAVKIRRARCGWVWQGGCGLDGRGGYYRAGQ